MGGKGKERVRVASASTVDVADCLVVATTTHEQTLERSCRGERLDEEATPRTMRQREYMFDLPVSGQIVCEDVSIVPKVNEVDFAVRGHAAVSCYLSVSRGILLNFASKYVSHAESFVGSHSFFYYSNILFFRSKAGPQVGKPSPSNAGQKAAICPSYCRGYMLTTPPRKGRG